MFMRHTFLCDCHIQRIPVKRLDSGCNIDLDIMDFMLKAVFKALGPIYLQFPLIIPTIIPT